MDKDKLGPEGGYYLTEETARLIFLAAHFPTLYKYATEAR